MRKGGKYHVNVSSTSALVANERDERESRPGGETTQLVTSTRNSKV